MSRQLIAVFGGSFDPVHLGHVALAERAIALLQPELLRIVPASNPWQKQGLIAPPAARVAMLGLAFADIAIPQQIDMQEIEREGPAFTVDTLIAIRKQIGPDAALVFLLGADQLNQLHTWHRWRELFSLAHLFASSRPGFRLNHAAMVPELRIELHKRIRPVTACGEAACGSVVLDDGLKVDVSSNAIRTALRHAKPPASLLPPAVLDYIDQHHLYRTNHS
jgi:nicotinate-nucleotide adenylyltransferase